MDTNTLPADEQPEIEVVVSRIAYLAVVAEKRSYGMYEVYRITAHADGRSTAVDLADGSHTRSISASAARKLGLALIAADDAIAVAASGVPPL